MEAIVFLGIIIFTILIVILEQYNKLIRLRNKVKQAESGIDVYLTQRFDLIPNLVSIVKEYTNYEEKILTEIAELREKYNKEKSLQDGEKLNNECKQLIAVIENYPELKASEQYLNLQKSITKMENQLQAARRILGFKDANLFEADLPEN